MFLLLPFLGFCRECHGAGYLNNFIPQLPKLLCLFAKKACGATISAITR